MSYENRALTRTRSPTGAFSVGTSDSRGTVELAARSARIEWLGLLRGSSRALEQLRGKAPRVHLGNDLIEKPSTNSAVLSAILFDVVVTKFVSKYVCIIPQPHESPLVWPCDTNMIAMLRNRSRARLERTTVICWEAARELPYTRRNRVQDDNFLVA